METLRVVAKKVTSRNGTTFTVYSLLSRNGNFYNVRGIKTEELEKFSGKYLTCDIMRMKTVQETNKNTGVVYNKKVLDILSYREATEEEQKSFIEDLKEHNSSTIPEDL